MNRAIVFLAALACVALLAQPASATTVEALSVEDMATSAELIVEGTCVEARSVWQGRDLITLVTIQIQDSLKGETGETLTVALPGGIDASREPAVQMTYPGAPALFPGDEAILFLESYTQKSDAYVILGFSQGKYEIFTDGAGNKMVNRDLSGLNLVGADGSLKSAAAGRTGLDVFKQSIRDLVETVEN